MQKVKNTPSEQQLLTEIARVRYKHRKNPVDYLINVHKLSRSRATELCARIPTREAFETGIRRIEEIPAPQPSIKLPTATGPLAISDEDVPVLQSQDHSDSVVHLAHNVMYNRLTGDYGTRLDKLGAYKFLKADDHLALMYRYTGAIKNPNDNTAQMAADFKFNSKGELEEYASRNRWFRNSPQYVTTYELQTMDREQLKRLTLERREHIEVACMDRQRKDHEWALISDDARRWREFQLNKLNPLMRVLLNDNGAGLEELKNKWNIQFPRQALRGNVTSRQSDDDCLVVTLSDIHFGAKAQSCRLVHGEAYNFKVIDRIMKEYAGFIEAKIAQRRKPFKRIWLFVLGDLLHGLDGETVKGVKLEVEGKGMEQYLPAYYILRNFIERMCLLADEVKTVAVRGNHAGDMDLMLVHAVISSLTPVYRGLELCSSELQDTQFIETHPDVVFAINHGASAEVKAKLPGTHTKRESYLNGLFTRFRQKYRYHIQGDLHHYFRKDIGGVEDILLPSTVLGDNYADAIQKHSQAGQKVFVVGNSGISEEWSYNVNPANWKTEDTGG